MGDPADHLNDPENLWMIRRITSLNPEYAQKPTDPADHFLIRRILPVLTWSGLLYFDPMGHKALAWSGGSAMDPADPKPKIEVVISSLNGTNMLRLHDYGFIINYIDIKYTTSNFI